MAKLARVVDLKPHPKLDDPGILPRLTDDEYAGLRASIEAHGIQQPLVVTWPERVIVDGHHRWRIARELRMPEVPVVPFEGADEKVVPLGIELNAARRQMTNEQKRAAVLELLVADARRSDRSIAASAGTSHPFVANVRQDAEKLGLVETVTTVKGADGVKQPRQKRRHGNGTGAPKRKKKADETGGIPLKSDGSIDRLAQDRQVREERAREREEAARARAEADTPAAAPPSPEPSTGIGESQGAEAGGEPGAIEGSAGGAELDGHRPATSTAATPASPTPEPAEDIGAPRGPVGGDQSPPSAGQSLTTLVLALASHAPDVSDAALEIAPSIDLSETEAIRKAYRLLGRLLLEMDKRARKEAAA